METRTQTTMKESGTKEVEIGGGGRNKQAGQLLLGQPGAGISRRGLQPEPVWAKVYILVQEELKEI